MLVPSMTLEEMRKDLEKDFPIVCRKGQYVYEKLLKQLAPRRDEEYYRTFDYYSKHKNTWIFSLIVSKKKPSVHAMVYFYGKRGLTGIRKSVSDGSMAYYTAHFFKRYNERLNLGFVFPEDIIRAYLKENPVYNTNLLEEFKPGLYKIFSSTKSGILLGTYDKHIQFLKINTFISRDMLKGDQVARDMQLKKQLDKYLPFHQVLD